MQTLSLLLDKKAPIRPLFLGAHSDDIELGCGGAVLSLLEQAQELDAHWVVFSSTPERRLEAEKSADMFLKGAHRKEIIVKDFKDGFFPYIGAEIKNAFEELKHRVTPDIIFTHYRHDLHQDHRLISELTWNTFRDHLILEYEIMKYDGDLGSPNVFVHLSEEIFARKKRIIMDTFKSQHSHAWFSEDTFLALQRLRGLESNAPQKLAEAFYGRKIVMK
jgi:LmbE family N-acetylglucosaminyl deacetylase